MNNELISIIVPVYNVEKYIAKCLDSLVNQTYLNIEILLIDDGSTDNTKEVVSKIACGEKAGEYLYGNSKFRIINNGIDLEKYQNVSKFL